MMASKSFQTFDLKQVNEYEKLRKGYVGFTSKYLLQCEELKSDDEVNIDVFTEFVHLDSKLGTTATEQLYHCVFYLLRFNRIKVRIQFRNLKIKPFKLIDMSQVDFGYIGSFGNTIFTANIRKLKKYQYTESKLAKLVKETEKVFEFLVKEGNKYGFNVDSILEIPDSTGATCFTIASNCSEKISNYIIARPIQVNYITIHMVTPFFEYPNLAIRMMKKEINPYVIDYGGDSQFDFISEEAQNYASKEKKFPRSIHFSIKDVNCRITCSTNCSSNLRKFVCKNGPLVEKPLETEKNRIGIGGFGMVFRQLFHGKPSAMKCIWTDEISPSSMRIKEALSDFNENISEIRIQTKTVGPCVIVPEAFVRQQDQEQDENGNWIANNYNIFIYPLYDCNLYDFHKNHYDQLTEETLRDILNQCLTRKCSNRLKTIDLNKYLNFCKFGNFG